MSDNYWCIRGAMAQHEQQLNFLRDRLSRLQENCEHEFPQRDNEYRPKCKKCGKLSDPEEWTLDL